MKLFKGLSLGKRIALLASVGLVAALGIFSFLSIRAVSQSVDTMLQDRMTLAQLTAGYIDDKLSGIKGAVEGAAQARVGSDPSVAASGLKTVASGLTVEITGVYEVDGDGAIAWSEPALASRTMDLALYSTVGDTLATGKSGISGLVPSPSSSSSPVVMVSAAEPMGASGKTVAMVVAIDLAKSSIAGLIQPLRLGSSGYVEVLDQNGIVVARTQPGPSPGPFEVSDHSGRFAALISEGQATRGVCHSCHESTFTQRTRDVLAFAPLSQAKWGVAVRQSEQEAFTPISRLRQNLLLSGVGMFGIVGVFITVTLRDTVGRIGRLTSASERIAGGDLATPIVSTSEDELGILARSLDGMRTKLKGSYEELQHKDEMRRDLLREVLAMQEEDRRRIARELHDETSQVIASLSANLEAIVTVLPEGMEKAVILARKTQALSVKILDEIHRLIYELRPSLLDDMGLVSAARWLAENNLETNGVSVDFKVVGGARRLPSELEVTLFRVIQEAMNNIIRHADAKKVRIALYFRKKSILVQIKDDGKGFDVEEAINTKDRPRGLGLLGMRERVELVRGKLEIRSDPRGGGTVVEVRVPTEEGRDGKD
jgi:signal transduction histidine kinase